jgi:hypothetical protein
MAKSFQKPKPTKQPLSLIFLITALIIIGTASLLIKPLPFIIIVTSIVGVLILLCRIFFKQLAVDHPEAFNLLIALVSVIIGVYLGITANQIANEKEEKKQLVKLVSSTKRM